MDDNAHICNISDWILCAICKNKTRLAILTVVSFGTLLDIGCE